MEATTTSLLSAATQSSFAHASHAAALLASDALPPDGPAAEPQAAQAAAASPPAVETPESWILKESIAGHKPVALFKAMVGSGWQEDVAFDTLLKSGPAIQQAVARATHGQSQPMPEPLLAGSPSTLIAADRTVQVLMQMHSPRVVSFGGFLSDAECDELIELASPCLERSTTVSRQDGSDQLDEARTSDGMFFFGDNLPALVRRIDERAAALLNWPVERGESMQVLRYRPGAEYRSHHDYFDPARPGSAGHLKRGGQRVGTLLIYLNTPAAGGSTTFPEVNVEVRAVKGNALFFSYDCPHPSTRTLHSGAPVIEGVKWVATKWLRQGAFA